VLSSVSADGWSLCERREPLHCWVLVERRDGTTRSADPTRPY
jgi:hypothetical protein